ncbi:ABC transporter ATP-binding protein [Agromyces subbeticus]|uniref:ABC transporter ATP-binding protein n=1 Tax=Agromyces subbeticus TaxID=293890 RepID=UPI0003B761E0|nr:ABC transporter ATP-binding protein [Agromyces subbeticus]
MPHPPLLELDRVSIRHEGARSATPIDVSFTVARGEVVLILGPSGCGKSTLTLALDGLIPHAVPATLDGTVLVAGLDTSEHPVGALSEHVAMVFQDPDAQIVTGTVLDEVCFAPENQLVAASEVLERAERALKLVGLWSRRAENPDTLSGGGRQRLAIACALAMAAPVLVLDEPTANLDPAGIDEVYAVLRELASDRDHAVVLVEHNLDAAVDIVDRVIVLDADGRLVIDGPARETLRERADELAALGVWLPVSTLAAMRLRDAGVVLDPLPLTPAELGAALDAVPVLPAPLSASSPVRSTALSPRPAVHSPTSPHAAPAAAVSRRLGQGVIEADPVIRARGLSVQRGGRRGPTVVEGVDPARCDARDRARRIGFVFQNPEHQFIAPSVAEELAQSLRVQGTPDAEAEPQIDAMLRRFGLESLREQHPFLLSGGQKRRLSVGTALIAGAPVLALDEPTFGQDRARASELLDMLRTLNDEGTTVLVVTHDLQLVADYASHIAAMHDGRLLAVGPAAEVLAGPLVEQAGLRHPPLARATRGLVRHPSWHGVSRMSQLPVSSAAGS